MLSYQIYVHLENWRTFQTQIIYDFPAVWNYGMLSTRVFLSSVKVIDTMGFCRLFQSFTQTTIKIPPNLTNHNGAPVMDILNKKA